MCDLPFLSPATAEIHTLSLHDALPIFDEGPRDGADERLRHRRHRRRRGGRGAARRWRALVRAARPPLPHAAVRRERSEEHTSELQSRRDIVCRLLLEKKKYNGWYAQDP